MFTFLFKGHVSTCPIIDPASLKQCHCQEKRYILTGILAVVTGVIESIAGLSKTSGSNGLTIDGIHGSFDGTGDFIGSYAEYRSKQNPHRADEIRRNGNRVIGILLFLGGLWFAYEAIERTLAGYSPHPPSMLLYAGIALATGIIRYAIIHGSPFKNETNRGQLYHAFGDVVISAGVVTAGLCAAYFDPFLISWNVSLYLIDPKWSDQVVSLFSWVYVGLYIPQKLWRGVGHAHSHEGHHHD